MSNGGVASAAQAARRPVTLMLSGPAAGVLGGLWAGQLDGRRRLITFDVGGTSADIGIVTERGVIEAQARDTQVAGYPLLVPMVDVHTIGAGGGSIAHRDPGGAFRVGPAQRRGHPRPGRLRDGRHRADPHRRQRRARPHRPGPLPGRARCGSTARPPRRPWAGSRRASGCRLLEAAEGIVTIANANMAGAIRSRTIQKGHDPREFTLVAFGGGGPLAAAEVADLLGAPEVLVPPFPGITAATGLLTSDLKYDQMRTVVHDPGRDRRRSDRPRARGHRGRAARAPARRRRRGRGRPGRHRARLPLPRPGLRAAGRAPGGPVQRGGARGVPPHAPAGVRARVHRPDRGRQPARHRDRACVRRSSACRPRRARWTMP